MKSILTMNENDRKLINKGIVADDWNQLSELEKQAESPEAKEILHARMIHLYRKEEAFADQL